jgi:oligopeptide/dipeptide ABC transporter ATP-binding protein
MLGIVGESGCGKTMTAMSLVQLLPRGVRVSSGQVRFRGEELIGTSAGRLRQVRGAEIGVVFQDPMTALNPLFGVGRQVAEPLALHHAAKRGGRMRRAAAVLGDVGIPQSEHRLKDRPFEFSGGMRQRVLIAEALICNPKLLIADEPTTGLDVTIQVQILALLDRMRKEHGMGVVLISHDLTLMAQVCDRIAVMYAGQVVEIGPTAKVMSSPRHPYTVALAASVPSLATRPGELLPALAGAPPVMTGLGPGCSFAPRCPLAEERCLRVEPRLAPVDPDRLVACWVVEQGRLVAPRGSEG